MFWFWLSSHSFTTFWLFQPFFEKKSSLPTLPAIALFFWAVPGCSALLYLQVVELPGEIFGLVISSVGFTLVVHASLAAIRAQPRGLADIAHLPAIPAVSERLVCVILLEVPGQG